jgi:PAS domain S-box-containing protein
VNVDPQRDADGIVRNVIVSFVEITEQRRAAEALRESEAQLRLLAQAVKSTGESISITDLEGRFTFVNPAFATTCGYTEAELIGQPVALINSPLNPPGLQAEVREATRRDRAWSGELYNRRKDGTDFPIALTTAQVKDSEGRVIALMGVSSDITERRQLRESVRRSETMSALGAVVAGVAHEVRNPLFGISATVDAFEARFGADPAHQRYTQTLRQSVGRLTKLMQDLLEYGRPPRLDVANVEIARVIERAVAACEALATNGGVTIRQDVPDRLPRVPLDPSRIQQVFQNLIENAIQHSPQGGTVMVVAAAGNGGLEVTVADQGSGFRGEDLPHLFEPFFTRRRGGTGLGLSIVQRIIEQHGGEVAARNGPQGGAVVTVNLKLAEAARVQA